MANDCLTHLTEENVNTEAYALDSSLVDHTLKVLEEEFPENAFNAEVLKQSISLNLSRISRRDAVYSDTVS
jgi:hypothetical protein